MRHLGLLKYLDGLTFGIISLFVLAAPWMLGSWEMWYFWPMAALLFAGITIGGIRLFLLAMRQDGADDPDMVAPRLKSSRFLTLVACWLPFLIYATIRHQQTPVVMDSERIWLLIVTPALLIVTIWLNFSHRQSLFLFQSLAVSMVLQAAYGFVAFYVFEDKYVMWAPNFFGYHGRAQGSFFCPNHFSGYLELGFGMGLAVMLTALPAGNRRCRAFHIAGGAILLLSSLAGIAISQSRGGWLTLPVVLAAAGIFGLGAFPRRTAFLLRTGGVTVLLALIMVAMITDNPIRRRIHRWPAFTPAARQPEKSLPRDMFERARFTSRGRMIGGALRAWRSAPLWGIGPGMHQNLWFKFAATGDGDRESGRWPTQTNHDFHSYEVHSDWVQLLEEFGLAGLALFLPGYLALNLVLLHKIRRKPPHNSDSCRALAAWLGLVAISFHSLGDFNLQIPAVNWALAALVALGLVREKTDQAC